MSIFQSFRYEGNVSALLDGSLIPWRATGTYGIEQALGLEQKTPEFTIYVEKSTYKQWVQYITSQGAQPAQVLPNVHIIITDKLPKPLTGKEHVANIATLVRDARTCVVTRFVENHRGLIARLKKMSA